MNRTDVAKLLTIVSGFDRRQVDQMTVEAWHAIPEIAEANFDVARRIAIEHHGEPGSGYFEARTLVAGLRKLAPAVSGDIEADVRSAKARGLIERDWPKREPLPVDVAAKLSLARQRDRDEARRYLELDGDLGEKP